MSPPPPLQHHHQGMEVKKSAPAIVFKKWSQVRIESGLGLRLGWSLGRRKYRGRGRAYEKVAWVGSLVGCA
ncbi:unnamed protein product [Prunus armeniaca]|uniref:Uncharacterized protein n=1 Tax=Prunus armeniaca TaxID=36596 RepID=A0A6J5VP84_PRUAR|nr:unnamed protein product [Prunus armeniaca]